MILQNKPAGAVRIVQIFIICAFIGAVLVSGFLIFKEIKKNNFTNNSISTEEKEDINKDNENEEDWVIYNHPVLGLEFKYKKEWGAPQTKSSEYITNLETVNKDLLSGNAYFYSIIISFPNGGPGIEIFNNDYPGELYPNSRAYQYGPIDNFLTLKETKNICDYKVDFRNNPSGTGIVTEDYSECDMGVKTVLLKDTKNFDPPTGTKYQYALKHHAFKKLENGYFDDLLATYLVGFSHQLDKDNVSFDNFLDQTLIIKGETIKEPIPKEKYQQDKEDFIKFASSIKTFVPEPRKRILAEIMIDDVPEIVTIKTYYNHLASGQLEQAYEMYLEKEVDFAEYGEWYKTTILAKPRDFEKISKNTYKFYVDYQEDNKKPQIYKVIMEVSGNKIKTLSSEEITSEKSVFGEMSAFTKNLEGYNYVILEKDGKEIEVDKASDNISGNLGDMLLFKEVKFSLDGKYLTYKGYGYEWSVGRVYDIAKNKIVLKLSSMHHYGFTHDDKYFYACANDNFGGEQYINIYSLPNFDLIKTGEDLQLFKDIFFIDITCQLDQEKNILNIVTKEYQNNGDSYQDIERKYKYDFEKDTINEIMN